MSHLLPVEERYNSEGTYRLRLPQYLAVFLALHQLIFASASAAQPPPSAAQISPPMTGGLKILVLEGQHSINNTRRHVGIQPVVEVRDENDRPIESATVVFRLPPQGPGGSFPGQKLTLSVKTNARGQAGASGFVPNDDNGSFDIRVSATSGNRMGEAVIAQTNSPTKLSLAGSGNTSKPLWKNKYILIGAAAVVVAVVVVVLTRNKSATKNPTVTITPGPVTINQ